MRRKLLGSLVPCFMVLMTTLCVTQIASAQPCFSAAEQERAQKSARVYRDPDADYDPVLGYNTTKGPRKGSPPVGTDGVAMPVSCVALKNESPGSGTTPKFYCTVPGNVDAEGNPVRYKVKPHFKGQSPDKRNGEVYGEFLSSRFSKAMGFFADDEWVADVTCNDCQKSLTKSFQGTAFSPFQPAAGIELPLGKGLDKNCDGKDAGSISGSLQMLLANGAPRAEIDAFKLWLAFIDHGDTKTDNQKFACLDSEKNGNNRVCKPGESVFYVSDMGSTFGYSTASEKKARLETWRKKDPIKASGGTCESTAKSIGDAHVSEAGRQLLAKNLQRLLDAEDQNGTITRIFAASRNAERDQPPREWTAEFIRKARTIIDARCGN